jgi:hypothetical protein
MNNRIINLITNKGALLMALNLIEYLKASNTNNYIVYCLDSYSANYCKENNIPYVDYSEKSNCPADYSNYNTTGFRDVTLNKFYIWLELLGKYETVFYIDADIVVFDNPFNDIEEDLKTSDIIIHPDDPNNPYGWMCTGYICMNNTPETIKFLEMCVEEATSRIVKEQGNSYYYNDQVAFNDIYRLNPGLVKIKLLDDITKYYNGGSIVRNEPFYMDKIIMFHNNCVIGANTKIDRFKQMDAWKISSELENLIK